MADKYTDESCTAFVWRRGYFTLIQLAQLRLRSFVTATLARP